MTNSEAGHRAALTIKEVFELISEEYLQARIDEPIEQAAASFEFDQTAPVTHQKFTQVTRDFIRHVCEKALWGWQEMSATEASTEAVAILEEGYQALHGQGYYAAYLDASNVDGLRNVLAQMARYIAMRARARHIRWVCASKIEMLDWPTRCLIAEILLKDWQPFLPEKLRACQSMELANHLSDLINVILSINATLGKMLDGNLDLPSF